MSASHDDHLDALLRRWADARRPSDEQMARLHESTLRKLTAIKFLDLATGATHSPRHWRMYGAAAAIAAAVLIAVGLRYPRWPAHKDAGSVAVNAAAKPANGVDVARPMIADDVPESAKLAPQQLARKAKLIKVLQETFADELLWVSETEGEIHVGLRSDDTPSTSDDNPHAELAVRVVLAARKKHDLAWTTLCRADVLTEPQELVEVPLDTATGGRLAVWTCLLPDGLIALDTDVRLNGPRGLHASSSMVQRQGVPCHADSSEQDGWEYRVYQTVERLPLGEPAPSHDARPRRRS